MKYIGEFRSINNKLYQINIITNGDDSQTTYLTLGKSPFTTEMDDSDDTIYKPCKYQSATINIITPDYNFDIYSSTAQGTKVELWSINVEEEIDTPIEMNLGEPTSSLDSLHLGTIEDAGGSIDVGEIGDPVEPEPFPDYIDENKLLWTGYVTPNLYDQGFDEDREEISVEAIDALSTLQYYKYSPINQDKGMVTFCGIVNHLLVKCNAYNNFYISNNIYKTANESITEKLIISEQNFFDSKESDETDEDVAWTCQEVLEEVCQYLGLTCVADGDSVYFLDYDAIKHGQNQYYCFEVGNTSNRTLVTKSFTKTITGSDYSSNGAKLSLDNVYNKVVVKAELYDFDKVLPDFFDNAINITKPDPTLTQGNPITGYLGEYVGTDDPMLVFINLIDGVQNDDVYNAVFVKYYHNNNFKFYKYNSSGNDVTTNYANGINYTDTQQINGAVMAKVDVEKLAKSSVEVFFEELISGQTTKTLDEYLAENEISSVNFSDYIFMMNHSNSHINNNNITQYPYFETTLQVDSNAIFGGDNAYLVISGDFYFHSCDLNVYPIQSDEVDINNGRKKFNSSLYYILAKLQIGNQYWNGEGWQSAECTFKIDIKLDKENDGWNRYDHIMFKNWKLKNTVHWRIGTNKTGYLVQMPNNQLITGLPKLTVYKPMDFEGETSQYKSYFVALKGFKMEAIIGDPDFSNDGDTDTVYTNVIDDQFVNELDDFTFKINTWDNKEPNYSCVGYKNGQTTSFIDTVYNKALKNQQTGTIRFDGSVSDGSMRFEEQLIYRITNQYSTPSVILELNLKNNNMVYGLFQDTTLSGKQFIIDSMNCDYKMNSQVIKLVEKK